MVPFELERVKVAASLAQLDEIVAASNDRVEAAKAAFDAAQRARAARAAPGRPYTPIPSSQVFPSGPRPVVVLATFPSLETGFARELFHKWAGESRNLVLFTDRTGLAPGTTGAQLATVPTPRYVSLHTLKRVTLQGPELRRWEEAREEAAKAAAAAAEAERAAAAAAAGIALAGIALAAEEGLSDSDGGDHGEASAAGAADDAMGTTGSGIAGGMDVEVESAGDGERLGDAIGLEGAHSSALIAEGEDEPMTYTDDEDDDIALARDLTVGSLAGVPRGSGPVGGSSAAGHGARFPMFSNSSSDAQGPTPTSGGASGAASAAGAGDGAKKDAQPGAWTNMGAAIDPADFREKRKPAAAAAAASDADAPLQDGLSAGIRGRLHLLITGKTAAGASAGGGGDGEDEVPTKLIRASMTVRVGCGVKYLPFDGRADAPAIRNIVEDIAPLRLVLVHGPPDATAALADACRPHCMGGVVVPSAGQPTDVGSGSGEFEAVLDDSLYRRLAFRQVGPYDVAFLDAAVAPGPSPALIPAGAGGALSGGGHDPSLIRPGTLLLPDIRKRLQRAGIECDLVEGGLVTRGAGIIIQVRGPHARACV